MYVWLLNSALRRALRRRGVAHDRDHDRYYFLADHEEITRRVAARSKLGRAQPQKKVVRQEGERSGNLRDVWWHLAAQLRFEEFSPNAWGLTIRPEFHLTTDGSTPLEPTAIGRRITSRKSRMYNEGYFDAVHFWRYFLVDGQAKLTSAGGVTAADTTILSWGTRRCRLHGAPAVVDHAGAGRLGGLATFRALRAAADRARTACPL
jgi:hypothetical protein